MMYADIVGTGMGMGKNLAAEVDVAREGALEVGVGLVSFLQAFRARFLVAHSSVRFSWIETLVRFLGVEDDRRGYDERRQ